MKKEHREGWVEVLPSHAFKLPVIEDGEDPLYDGDKQDLLNISFLRNMIRPCKKVKYFPETIKVIREKDGEKMCWILVMTEKIEKLFIPIFALNFSKEQKIELMVKKRIPKKYFNYDHLVSAIN